MIRRCLVFLRGASVNGLSRAGVILAVSSLLVYIVMEFLRVVGLVTNAFVGLVGYLALPFLFVLGLLLIVLGIRRLREVTGKPVRELLPHHFSERELKAGVIGSELVQSITLLGLVSVIFLGVSSARMLHFMDQSSFCGTACHRVMNPEWTTYRQSPHARVNCVDCHVGEGVGALIDSKLNGAWQMISATFDLYERPIPTPVRNLRPARETCEKCHWPEKFHGNRIRRIVSDRRDEGSSPIFTTLMMKIGSGREGMDEGSHWHVAGRNEVRYSSVDDEREEMIWVEHLQPDGTYRRYRNTALSSSGSELSDGIRTLDCVDCHNRATHIYEDPERAVDLRIRQGLIDGSLPLIKERALGALLSGYPDADAAMSGIDSHIRNFYREIYPGLTSERGEAVDSTVAAVQAIYKRNIHLRMKVAWNSYPSHLGHRAGGGCFRCHNRDMKDEEGQTISMDCTLCHSILALEGKQPFEYLLDLPADSMDDPSREIHRYLQEEFRSSL